MVRDELGDSTWSGRCSGVICCRIGRAADLWRQEEARLVFHVQSCGSNGKRCVDGSERLLSWLGYQYVCLVRCAAVLATEEFLDGRLGRSSAEDVGEAQRRSKASLF